MQIDTTLLTLDEKQRLADKLAYELRAAKFVPSDREAILWDALLTVLKTTPGANQVRPGLPGLEQFMTTYSRRKYRERADQMAQLLDEALPVTTRRAVRDAVRQIVIRCVARDLFDRNVPIGPKTLLEQFGRLRWCIDQHFPGYIECQMLHKVAQIAA